MAIQRTCDGCGVEYEAQRRTSRYHSPACGVAARRRARLATEIGEEVSGEAAPEPASPPEPIKVGTAAAVRALLEQAGRLDTIDGQCALALAASIDKGTETGSALAGAIKALRETMRMAMEGVAAAQPSTLDQLKERRERRRAAL